LDVGKGSGRVEKQDGLRSGESGNEMGGDDMKVSECKNPVGKSLDDVSEEEKP
jgi:hypothetical protein